jgi:hypothetical protein
MLTGIRAANTVLASLAERDAAAEWAEDALEWDQGPRPLPDDGDSDSDASSGSDSDGARAGGGRRGVRRRGDKAERGRRTRAVLPWTQRLGELDAALEARAAFTCAWRARTEPAWRR